MQNVLLCCSGTHLWLWIIIVPVTVVIIICLALLLAYVVYKRNKRNAALKYEENGLEKGQVRPTNVFKNPCISHQNFFAFTNKKVVPYRNLSICIPQEADAAGTLLVTGSVETPQQPTSVFSTPLNPAAASLNSLGLNNERREMTRRPGQVRPTNIKCLYFSQLFCTTF